MTAAGWIIALGSWAAILALNVFCFYRFFTAKPAEPITREETPQSQPPAGSQPAGG